MDTGGTQRTVQVRGVTVAYRDVGSGPVVVPVHGLFLGGAVWDDVVAGLLPGHRCVVPDLPLGGHRHPVPADVELSPPAVAGLILGFLEALDLSDVTLVGNDTGGAMCQLAITSGDPAASRIGRLVLTDSDAFEDFLPASFRSFSGLSRRAPGLFPRALGVLFGSRRGRRQFFGSTSSAGVEDDRARALLAPFATSQAARRDCARVMAAIEARYTQEAAERFGSVRQPVLLAWGEDDEILPIAHAERMVSLFPDARLVRLANCSTFAPLDQPARLAELIAEHAARPAPDAGAGAPG